MKFIFFTGKGGVGKSTIAAAAAWQLAQRHRVLIVSLDPAHNLGDIFGVPLDDRATPFGENLFLREVNLERRSRAYLEREIAVLTETYRYVESLNLDSYFSILKYSPGLEEYALITSIEEILRNDQGYDYIVFDTPPTGLTLRFLALPRVTITWIDSLIGLRRVILKKRHTVRKILGEPKPGPEAEGKAGAYTARYDEKEDRVLGRLLEMRARYGALHEELQGERCTIVVVFNPDRLSLRESERLIAGFQALNFPVRLFVDNKVTPENQDIAGQVETALRARVNGVIQERVPLVESIRAAQDARLFDVGQDLTAHL